MKIIYQNSDKSTSLLEHVELSFLELTLAGEASYDEYQTFFETYYEHAKKTKFDKLLYDLTELDSSNPLIRLPHIKEYIPKTSQALGGLRIAVIDSSDTFISITSQMVNKDLKRSFPDENLEIERFFSREDALVWLLGKSYTSQVTTQAKKKIDKNAKLKTILLPTDFSDNARNAIKYAVALFKGENYQFLLVHAYLKSSQNKGNYLGELSEINIEKEKAFLKKMTSKRVYATLEVGDLDEVLAGIVKNNHSIEYIIMGTKGANGITESSMGSNTSKVIQEVSCPVIAVPELSSFECPRKILLTVDYAITYNEETFAPIINMASKFDAEVMVFNVRKYRLPDAKEEMQRAKLDANLKGLKRSYFFDLSEEHEVADAIEVFIKKHKIEMLVSIARSKAFFDKHYQKSTTQKLALYTHLPLLAMHTPE
jgi:nucleotide-binding universal stress UspA family protein